eukprot:355040-Chlamydomonas_euryale.AAC.2
MRSPFSRGRDMRSPTRVVGTCAALSRVVGTCAALSRVVGTAEEWACACVFWPLIVSGAPRDKVLTPAVRPANEAYRTLSFGSTSSHSLVRDMPEQQAPMQSPESHKVWTGKCGQGGDNGGCMQLQG